MSASEAPIATDCRVVVRRCPEGHVHLAIISAEITLDLPLSAQEARDLALSLGTEAITLAMEQIREEGQCQH